MKREQKVERTMDDMFSRKYQEESEEHPICTTSSSDGKENLFVKFSKSYMWEAINHYLACNQQQLKEQGELCNYSASEESSRIKTRIKSYEIQKQTIEKLHNYFVQDQKRHIMVLMDIVSCKAFDDPCLKTEADAFIQNECSKGHKQQHYALVKKLLQLWNIWDDKIVEEDTNTIHLCCVATNLLQKKCKELNYLGASIDCVQSLFWRRIAREDFLNQEQGIKTIQKYLRKRTIRSSIEHMFFKPKTMIHVGGSVLDLSMDEMLQGKSIHKLDLTAKKPQWQTLCVHLPKITAHAGVAVCGNKVFISGGRNSSGSYLFSWEAKTVVYNTAHLLTLHDDRLQDLPPMGDSRSHHGFITFRGTIWAIGGSNGINSLKTVESFDPTTLRWNRRPQLNQERSGAAVTVHENQIWVIGGRNSEGEILSSVEIYDAKEKIWRYSKSNLPKPLLLSTAISNLGQLFVIGGLTGSKETPIAEATIYRWNNKSGCWQFWNKMQEPRLNHSVTRYGEYISIIGGHGLTNGVPTHVSSATCFHIRNDEGEIYTPKIGTQRIGVGIAMVGDHKIIDDVVLKTQSFQERKDFSKSDCLSCASSFICNKYYDGQRSDCKRSQQNLCEISFSTQKNSE